MTQHPFDREFSEQEAAKLNAEKEQIEAEQELTDNDLEEVAGGILTIAALGYEGGITARLLEVGGPISKKILETGGSLADK